MAKKGTTDAVVLDSSVVLAWYFEDEANRYADAVAVSFPNVSAVVPAIWPLEVANAILMGERRKRSTREQATKWLGYLGGLPIIVEEQTTARAWSDVIHLARAHKLTAYDAAYLELALRRGLPIASLDDTLKKIATAVGVSPYKPLQLPKS